MDPRLLKTDPKQNNSTSQQINQINQIQQNFASPTPQIFNSDIKVNRPAKIQLKADQNPTNSINTTKQIIRSARSGSIKQKLNLQNTRLKINVQNLSSLISLHQNNQSHFKIQLDRNKEKLIRYKQKIKQKDNIIAKLLIKLERRIQIDGGSLQNMLFKLHQQNIKQYNSRLARGEHLENKEVVQKYQQLLKGFTNQQKQRLYLQKQKEDLEKTVLQLKQIIKYVGDGLSDKGVKQSQSLRIKLNQAQNLLIKQKNARIHLIDSLRNSNVQILPQLKTSLKQIQKGRSALLTQNGQFKQDYGSIQQISNLKQKLAQSETILLNQRQIRKSTQKQYTKIENELSSVSQMLAHSNTNINALQNRLDNVLSTYKRQFTQLEQKTQILLKDSTDLQQYRRHLQQSSLKFAQTIKSFNQQSEKWSKLQDQYQKRIDKLRKQKRELNDRLERQIQRRRIFQLKIVNYDEEVMNNNNKSEIPIKIMHDKSQDIQKNEQDQFKQRYQQKTQYLDERVDIMRNQSLKNKKQNQYLTQQLSKSKRIHQILQHQLKESDERIFKLQQMLTANPSQIPSQMLNYSSPQNMSHSQSHPQLKSLTQNQQNQQGSGKKFQGNSSSNVKSAQQAFKQIQSLSFAQLQTKVVDLSMQNNYLNNIINELRNKNVQIQIENEQVMVKLQASRRTKQNNQNSDTAHVYAQNNNQQTQKLTKQNKQLKQLIQNLNQRIQHMSFDVQKLQQQLSKRNESSSQHSHMIKQGPVRHIQTNLQSILSQNQYEGQDGNSQELDQATYRNINDEMDRLMAKNKDLQVQIQKISKQFQQKMKSSQQISTQLKDKLRSAQQINSNLSNIVIHLQSQLNRLQNNMDYSMQDQPANSQYMESSAKKDKDSDQGNLNLNLNKQILQKRKQFQDMLRSGSSINQRQSTDYQNKLKALQLQIRGLQQQSHKPQSRASITSNNNNDNNNDNECQNCNSLIKVNSELIRKINRLQQTNKGKHQALQKQLKIISTAYSDQSGFTGSKSVQQLQIQNFKLKQIVAQMKSQISYEKLSQEQYQNELKNIREINQQLVNSLHQKQKTILKMKTDIYRQNYQRGGGFDEEQTRKMNQIFQEYQRKIDQLQNLVKVQDKSETNIGDLYDTINYLNNQCQTLKKTLQGIQKQKQANQFEKKEHIQPSKANKNQQFSQKKGKLDELGSSNIPIQLAKSVSTLQQFIQANNFSSPEELISALSSLPALQQKNTQLMKQNNKLHSKIHELNQKTQAYFVKLNQGKIYEVIVDKDKQIQQIKDKNQQIKQEFQNLARQRHNMFVQNQKINADLKNIQDNIQKLTGQKASLVDSTLAHRSIDRSQAGQSTLTDPTGARYLFTPEQSQYIIQNIHKKLRNFASSLQANNQKSRPNLQLQSFQELPVLQQVITQLSDRIHSAWNIIQQRTNQYNQLRDQMNIISMQCMKNNNNAFQIDLQVQNSKSQSKGRQLQIMQQRYQQVLAQLVEYETQNKRLEKQVNRLKQQINQYKKQMEQMQIKYISEMKSQSSDDLPYNKQVLNRLLESGSSVGSVSVQKQIPEIIKLFLARIKQLQGNLQTIQLQFDDKNKRLQNLIQKQKSFISQKSKTNLNLNLNLNKQEQQSQNSIIQSKQLQTDRKQKSRIDSSSNVQFKYLTRSSGPNGPGQQKSYYSLNSAKVFKQIQELTKANQELRERKYRYRVLLEQVSRIVENAASQLQASTLHMQMQTKQSFDKIVAKIVQQLEQDSKKDHSGFDLQVGQDAILGASFSVHNKNKEGIKMQIGQNSRQGLEEIKMSLEQSKNMQNVKKTKKKQQQANKKIQNNLRFLDQNKFILDQLISKTTKIQKTQPSIKQLKQKLAQKLTQQQLQQILYLSDTDKAITKILHTTTTTTTTIQQQQQIKKPQQNNQNQASIQQGQWVQTQQLQAIINSIYPVKSQLCLIVANSINALMLAQTKQGILKAVQYLFQGLKRKENQMREQLKKRDENVTEYGRKLQKILQTKFSDDDSQNKSQMLNENSFKRTLQFKSQYQIKRQLQGGDRMNDSNNQSQSYSEQLIQK